MRRSRTSTARSRRGAARSPRAVAVPADSGAAAVPADSRAVARRAPSRGSARRRATEALVAVDVGNSETTVGRFRGEALDGFWRLTSTRLTADEISLLLAGLLGGARADVA